MWEDSGGSCSADGVWEDSGGSCSADGVWEDSGGTCGALTSNPSSNVTMLSWRCCALFAFFFFQNPFRFLPISG